MKILTREELIKKGRVYEGVQPKIEQVENLYCEQLVEKLPFETYRNLPGLNASTIVEGKKSMAHAKDQYSIGIPDSYPKVFGRYCHSLLLEPDRVQDDWVVCDGDRKGGKWKDAVARAKEENKDVICSKGEYGATNAANIIGKALEYRSRQLREIIGNGVSEVSMFAEWRGLQMRSRFDWLNTDRNYLIDFKFQYNVGPQAIKNAVASFGYNIKMPIYKTLLEKLTGNKVARIYLIFIATKGFPDITIRHMTDDQIEDGIAQAAEITDKIKEEIRCEHWYGQDDGRTDIPLEVPYYAMLEEQSETYKRE